METRGGLIKNGNSRNKHRFASGIIAFRYTILDDGILVCKM
jgi:hypothetical protein